MDAYLPTLSVAGVLGFLAPLLSSAINRLTWSSRTKQITAVVVSVVMASIALLVTGGFTSHRPDEDPSVYFTLVGLSVIAVSQMAYSLIWKPTGVDTKIAVATAAPGELKEYLTTKSAEAAVIVRAVG
jgi:hypothetical protein